MSRFSPMCSRAYLGMVLPSLAAPVFAGCDAPAYVIGAEDETAPPNGGATTAKETASMNSGSGGVSNEKGTGSATWSSSSGGKTPALAGTAVTDGGSNPTRGGAHTTTTEAPEQNDGQGGADASSLTSLGWSVGVGGLDASGGARAADGSTTGPLSFANAGGTIASGGANSTGGAAHAGGAANTSSTSASVATGGQGSIGGTTTSTGGAIGTGGRGSNGGAATTGGSVVTGGSNATGGTPSSGESTSTSPYCATYVDLGNRSSTSTEYKEIPTAVTCYRFAVTAANEVFRGIQMSNCDTRTVSINGTNPGCSPSTNCSVATYIARAPDGYFYVRFSAGSSTNCTSTWWWSP